MQLRFSFKVFVTLMGITTGHSNAANAKEINDPKEPVDMLLCLAADVSESVSPLEYRLQRLGHATAIEDQDVIETIKNGLRGKIAITYVEWAEQDQQFQAAKWHLIDSEDAARTFADTIRTSAPPPWIKSTVRNTATAEAIRFCQRQFQEAPVTSGRHVIDISSDGTNNVGAEVTAVRDAAVDRGVTINVLAISSSDQPGNTFTHSRPEGGLVRYFQNNVVGGNGAFVIPAIGYASFSDMLKQKFLQEIAGL